MGPKRGSFYVEEEILIRLVEGLKQDDKEAKEEFEKVFNGYISRYIHTKTHCEQDVEDLTKETIKTVYAKINNLNSPVALVRWVRTIAHSKIYHHYRDMERRQRREERNAAKKIKKRSRFLYIDLSDPQVVDLINQLPEAQKNVTMMRVEGLKVREIAAILDLPEGTVKSRLNYARKAMLKNISTQNE